MIAEKVNQYTCTCRAAFLSMRSMGHNKQKRKRKEKEIKTKKIRKKTKKGYGWLSMGDRAGETQPSCSWTQFRATDDSKKFKYTAFGCEASGLS